MAKTKIAPIVILGMHRSGTSLLASILHNIGISMGQQFLESDQYNANGYFEDEDFLGINKGIIENSGGIWYDPPPPDELVKGGKKFRTIIRNKVAQKQAKNKIWGWKDPRTCLTCWTYAEFVPHAKYIVIVRRIKDIKLSLNKTHGHLANWDKVIDRYYASIDHFLAFHPNEALSVGFEELAYEKYAEDTVKKILDFVDKSESSISKAMKVIQFR